MREIDSYALCESLDTSPAVVPPRSRLHSLEPVGAETAFVEGQTGYTARLAEAHGVTVAALFGWEVGPQVESPYLRRKLSGRNKWMVLASTFSPMARALNGTGETARSWIAAVQSLTLRDDLEQTTMLAWAGVLSPRGLTRKSKAWCPACYEQWRGESRIVYEPLIWSVQVVSSCAAHRRRLRERCGDCGRHLKHLASHSRPGYCSSCGQWLGTAPGEKLPGDEALGDAEYEWQRQVSAAVGEMLAAAPHLPSKPSKEVVATSTTACVLRGTTRGSIFALSGTSGVPKQTIANWCRRGSALQIEPLLRLCISVGVSPVDFLTGNLDLPLGEADAPTPVRVEDERQPPRPREKMNLDEVQRALEAALEEMPPPSLVGVSRRLGRTTSGVKYRFPELCRAIVNRQERHHKLARRKEWGKGRRALKAALEDESHPSVADVARKISWEFSRLSRRFPELCRQVSEKHSEHLNSGWSEIGRTLEGVLGEEPPPPMCEITKRLNRSAASLYGHFPRLCRLIGERHIKHRRKSFSQRREQFLAEVRRIALALHDEGIYPSVKRVEERLSAPKSLRSSKAALKVLREIRCELKLDLREVNPTCCYLMR